MKAPDIRKILAGEAERFEREKDKPPKTPYVRGRPRKPVGEVGQVYSIRLPVDRLGELQLLASSIGEQPTVLMRKWILERLDRENKTPRRQAKVIESIRAERKPTRPRGPAPGKLLREDRRRS